MRDVAVIGVGETEFGELWDRSFRDLGIEAGLKEIQSSTADQEWETVFGATFAGLYAMMARRHMYEYHTTREQMAAVAVKNHKNGSLNPEAQFQKEITLETVLHAPWVAEPLGLFDCAPLSDGAAAVVLCEMQKARKFTDTPIRIAGSGQASDFLALHDRRDLTMMDATVVAGKREGGGARRGVAPPRGGTGAPRGGHIFERGERGGRPPLLGGDPEAVQPDRAEVRGLGQGRLSSEGRLPDVRPPIRREDGTSASQGQRLGRDVHGHP